MEAIIQQLYFLHFKYLYLSCNHKAETTAFILFLKTTLVKMESIKIDRTKLITVQNYAKKVGLTRQTIYNKIKEKSIRSVDIDGVLFIVKD